MREHWSMIMIEAYHVRQEDRVTEYTIHILYESQYRG
jgi:hypothetical protein